MEIYETRGKSGLLLVTHLMHRKTGTIVVGKTNNDENLSILHERKYKMAKLEEVKKGTIYRCKNLTKFGEAMHKEKKIHNYKYSEESVLIETMQKKEKFNYDEDQLEILLGECIAQIDEIYCTTEGFDIENNTGDEVIEPKNKQMKKSTISLEEFFKNYPMTNSQKVEFVILSVSAQEKARYVAISVASIDGKIATNLLVYTERAVDRRNLKERYKPYDVVEIPSECLRIKTVEIQIKPSGSKKTEEDTEKYEEMKSAVEKTRNKSLSLLGKKYEEKEEFSELAIRCTGSLQANYYSVKDKTKKQKSLTKKAVKNTI